MWPERTKLLLQWSRIVTQRKYLSRFYNGRKASVSPSLNEGMWSHISRLDRQGGLTCKNVDVLSYKGLLSLALLSRILRLLPSGYLNRWSKKSRSPSSQTQEQKFCQKCYLCYGVVRAKGLEINKFILCGIVLRARALAQRLNRFNSNTTNSII